MIILPAIDLLGGQCVRLSQGVYESAYRVAQDPFETLARFAAAGAGYIHIVDLDGAKDGTRVNHALIGALANHTDTPVEVGGGIRTMETIEAYLNEGVSRVILGSIALQAPKLVQEAVSAFGDAIAVGIDAKDSMVRISGWLEESHTDYLTFARMMDDTGVSNIIYTDIGRDGMLSGVDAAAYQELNEAVSADITASGGVRDIADIRALKRIGIYGAICGKSIYSGMLDLAEAVEVGGEQ